MWARTEILGHLGKDVEMRFTPSGIPVANFSVATTQQWTGNDGQRHERTVWYRVTAWQKLAEICNNYLRKGHRVFVTGTLEEARPWTGRDGETRADLELRAQEVRFLTSRSEAEAMGAPGHGSQPNTQPGSGYNSAPPPGQAEEDIPF